MSAQALESLGAVPLSEMRGGLSDAAKGVPLGNREGTITAFAMVDAEDFWWASQHRWHITGRGYARSDVRKGDGYEPLMLHRAVMDLERDDPREVDHDNRDQLDCRRQNLRVCTHAQNMQNQGSRGGSSRFRGVTWDKPHRKWRAQVNFQGKVRNLGRFAAEEDAAEAASRFRAEHMPFSQDAKGGSG